MKKLERSVQGPLSSLCYWPAIHSENYNIIKTISNDNPLLYFHCFLDLNH